MVTAGRNNFFLRQNKNSNRLFLLSGMWNLKHIILFGTGSGAIGTGSCVHFSSCFASMDGSTGGYVTTNQHRDRRVEAATGLLVLSVIQYEMICVVPSCNASSSNGSFKLWMLVSIMSSLVCSYITHNRRKGKVVR